MLGVGCFSAFINNTPVVAIFIPILLGVANETKTSASKLLMPMSFASMLGGLCTLIGTSTNILVSSIAEQYKIAPFSMFEFTQFGLIMFGIGVLYMFVVGVRQIPERRTEGDLIQSFRLQEYITEVVLLKNSTSVGKMIKDAPIVNEMEIAIIEIHRGEDTAAVPSPEVVLQTGDVLRIRCDLDKFKKIQAREGVLFKPQLDWQDEDVETDESKLVEAVIAPSSYFIGQSLKKLNSAKISARPFWRFAIAELCFVNESPTPRCRRATRCFWK